MANSELTKRVREELICAVCLDFLRQPKVLACAHSFCASCLEGVHEKRLKQRDAYGSADTPPSPNELECPSCRHVTPLPEGGVAALKTHCKLSNLVDIVSEEEREQARETLRWRKSAYEELESGSSKPDCLCREHERALEYYCDDCCVLLCTRGMTEEHREHNCLEAVKVLPEHLEYLRSMVQPAHEIVARAETSMRRLEQDSESIETNRNVSTESIREVFNKLRAALDKREERLLATVNKYVDTKLATVQRNLQTLKEKRDSVLGIIESLGKVLNRPGDVRILNEEMPLSDALETEQDIILNTESEILKSLYSSSYVGFKDDNVTSIENQSSEVVTLLEFFPEGDSGYYSSRKIIVEGEVEVEKEVEEEDVYIDVRRDGTPRQSVRFGKAVRKKDLSESDSDTDTESIISEPSPQLAHRGSIQTSALVEDIAPMIPIRFDSLLAPSPVVEPLRLFDKLGRSKSDSVHPCGVCVCMNDSLVVSDVKNHCLRIIASNGKFIGVIGEEGSGSGNFEEPCGLTVDRQQNVLVTQRVNPRIQKFSPAGKYLQKFGQRTLLGSVLGEPWSITVSADKKIFISDWDKECIHIFQQNGKYIRSIGGEKEMAIGESLKLPAGIAFDGEGRLLVADRGSHCIWIMTQDGNLLKKFGSKGHSPGELYYPYGVAITQDGRVVVSESGNNRISIFSPSGQFLRCFGRKGSEPGMFDHPRQICVNSKNELIVADEINQRLQVFSLQND